MTTSQIQDLTGLLALTWNGNKKMIDHCLKNSKYIKIGNMFVDVCSSKPGITKTIWYDDTTDGPEANFENFKHENRYNMPHLFTMQNSFHYNEELYFIAQYNGDKAGGRLVSLVYETEPSRLPLICKVTEGDLLQINAAVEEVRADYDKRLNTYYARYGQHVRSEGYYANR